MAMRPHLCCMGNCIWGYPNFSSSQTIKLCLGFSLGKTVLMDKRGIRHGNRYYFWAQVWSLCAIRRVTLTVFRSLWRGHCFFRWSLSGRGCDHMRSETFSLEARLRNISSFLRKWGVEYRPGWTPYLGSQFQDERPSQAAQWVGSPVRTLARMFL